MDELSYTPIYDEKTRQTLEEQFARFQGECYVDHAGTTLYSDNQIKKSMDDLSTSFYVNPHSNSVNGITTAEAIDNIRYLILDHFHTNQDEYSIIFTSGATASIKIVAETFDFTNLKQTSDKSVSGNFVYLQDNHTSVLGMRDVIAQRGANVICLNHDKAFQILQENTHKKDSKDCKQNSLFVYSAQCNFSGLKYPLNWIEKVKNGFLNSYTGNETNWYTLLDAASFVATNDFDLSIFKPDFVCISFYKCFGYPSGIGALLVKNTSSRVLKKIYYGGGTVDMVLSSKMHHAKRENLQERFEDGTVSFLSIVPLQYGLKILSNIGMHRISMHVFSLARYLHHALLKLHHENGTPVIKLYGDTDYEDKNLQGGIVAFNILRANGEYVGYMEALNMAALYKIQFRTGCFCNPGACQRHLNLLDTDILKNYDTGFTCGGTTDLIDGKPTGAIRISFGYMSTIRDVETILHMIQKCFVNGKAILKSPIWWSEFKSTVNAKYKTNNNQNSSISNIFSNMKQDKINVLKENNLQFQMFKTLNNNNVLKNNARETKLSKIFIYPIKSCAAYEIKASWKLSSTGLLYDREWMIVTSAGVCLTQKQETKLCMLAPTIDLIKKELILCYQGMPPVRVPLNVSSYQMYNNKICKGKVCGHKVEGIDCGAEVSEWLSLALGRPNLKLIKQHSSTKSKQNNETELSFASQSQYLLINGASVLWLSDKIAENAECDKSTLLHRFRGNFVIEGCEPFEELNWKSIQMGNCKFEVDGVCTRCQMICINQMTGEKTVEPLRTLAEEFHGKLRFGIYLIKKFKENDILSIGDKVYYS